MESNKYRTLLKMIKDWGLTVTVIKRNEGEYRRNGNDLVIIDGDKEVYSFTDSNGFRDTVDQAIKDVGYYTKMKYVKDFDSFIRCLKELADENEGQK